MEWIDTFHIECVIGKYSEPCKELVNNILLNLKEIKKNLRDQKDSLNVDNYNYDHPLYGYADVMRRIDKFLDKSYINKQIKFYTLLFKHYNQTPKFGQKKVIPTGLEDTPLRDLCVSLEDNLKAVTRDQHKFKMGTQFTYAKENFVFTIRDLLLTIIELFRRIETNSTEVRRLRKNSRYKEYLTQTSLQRLYEEYELLLARSAPDEFDLEHPLFEQP